MSLSRTCPLGLSRYNSVVVVGREYDQLLIEECGKAFGLDPVYKLPSTIQLRIPPLSDETYIVSLDADKRIVSKLLFLIELSYDGVCTS